MGKKPKSILKVKGLSIYPYLLRQSLADQDGFIGINIRITKANTKGKGTTIDLEAYTKTGERIKATKKEFEGGKITGGYDSETLNSLNSRLAKIQLEVFEYLELNDVWNKDLIAAHVYGSADFLIQHKKKRTKFVTIPVMYKQAVVDKLELSSKEVNDLLNPFTDNNNRVVISDIETGENHIQSAEDVEELILSLHHDKEQVKAHQKRQQEVALMEPSERYYKNEYDKNDIFQLFYSLKFDKQFIRKGDFLAPRFYDYKERAKPNVTHVDKLTISWFREFIQFFIDNGYSGFSTNGFNPFDYDRKRIIESRIEPFTDSTVEKYCRNLRKVLRNFVEDKKIPNLTDREIKTLTPEKFSIKNINKKTRKNDCLDKEEFDKLYFGEFKDEYIDSTNPKTKVIEPKLFATKEELAKSRDIFVLMTWFGGLRPIEYNKANLLLSKTKIKGKTIPFVHYVTSDKNTKEIENPLTKYVTGILDKYNGQIPFMPEKNNESKNETLLIKHLRIMCLQLGLEKDILRTPSYGGKIVKKFSKLSDTINRYFARHTFIQILKDEGLHQEFIDSFTGHSRGGSGEHYYTNKVGVKLEQIEHIVPEQQQ